MTLSELRSLCWRKSREVSTVDAGRIWPIADMNDYINLVCKKIARETRCIRDASTAAVCLIASTPVVYTTYVAGTLDYIWANSSTSWLYHLDVAPYLYTLHTSIIEVYEVKWVTRSWSLQHVSCRKWQQNAWWEQATGDPTEYATDLTSGKIAVNFRSTTADTLMLSVARLPLTALSVDTDVPEIPIRYHELMVNGILYEMYSKQDAAEITGKDTADKYLNLYLRDIDEIKREETRMQGHMYPAGPHLAFR